MLSQHNLLNHYPYNVASFTNPANYVHTHFWLEETVTVGEGTIFLFFSTLKNKSIVEPATLSSQCYTSRVSLTRKKNFPLPRKHNIIMHVYSFIK